MIHSFMLNPFPELLSFMFLGPLFLRVVLGIMFIRWGYGSTKTGSELGRALGLVKVLAGTALVLGFLTQISSLLLIVITVGFLIKGRRSKESGAGVGDREILVLIILLSLLVTGAGAFALDLPL